MKIRYIVMLSIILFILSILLLVGRSETDKIIIDVVTVLSGLSSIATLIIALLLFKKLGIDQIIIQEKAKTVFHLIELIKKKEFTIQKKDGKNIYLNFWRFIPLPLPEIETKILFSISYYDSIAEIIALSESVFLPKEIANKIRLMELSAIAKVNNVIDYGLVVPAVKQFLAPVIKEPHIDEWGLFNGKEMTVNEFTNSWNDLINTVIKWIKENTKEEDLNIRTFEEDSKLFKQ